MVLSEGLLLGAAISAYMYLHPKAIGFDFPNLNHEWAIRPSWARLTSYLLGRWVGFLILGFLVGWLGHLIADPLVERLINAANVFLGVFIILFLTINQSPELNLFDFLKVTRFNMPLIINGLISTVTIVAPLCIAVLITLEQDRKFSGIEFFTYVFIGNTITSLPLLLNNKWAHQRSYKLLLRLILMIVGCGVLFQNIRSLLHS